MKSTFTLPSFVAKFCFLAILLPHLVIANDQVELVFDGTKSFTGWDASKTYNISDKLIVVVKNPLGGKLQWTNANTNAEQDVPTVSGACNASACNYALNASLLTGHNDKSVELFLLLADGTTKSDKVTVNFKKDVTKQVALPSGKEEYKAGIPLHDAIRLDQAITQKDPKVVLQILNLYYGDVLNEGNLDGIITRAENPFLFDGISNDWVGGIYDTTKNYAFGAGAAGLSLASIGGLDVTNIALGLADFVIDRTKTELNTAFFKRLNDELKSNQDLETLFPQTIQILSVIGVEIYQYDLYLNNLRTAFEKDLKGLLETMPEVFENHKDAISAALGPEVYPTIMLSFQLADGAKNGKNPGELLKLIAESEHMITLADNTDRDMKAGFRYAANGIQTVALISESLRGVDSESGNYWSDEKELQKLQEEDILKLYLGLVLRRCSTTDPYNQIEFPTTNTGNGNPKKLHVLLNNLGTTWTSKEAAEIRTFVKETSSKGKDIDDAISAFVVKKKEIQNNSNLTKRQKNKQLFDGYYSIYHSFINLAKQATKFNELPGIDEDVAIPDEAIKVIDYFEIGGEISVSIANQQYAGAVSQSAILLSDILVKNSSVLRTNPKGKQAVQKFLKYGSFMAALIEAETPSEVKSVLEAAALPPGSYTIKRESAFSVAVNGYVGAFGGYEFIRGAKPDNNAPNNIAITAPIGLSLSWGNIPRNWKHPFSIGVSIPIIDLGAVASYRFSNGSDSVEGVPTIQLQHILAPGAFLELGIGRTPLTLGLGWQMGPRLRKVVDGAEVNDIGDLYHRFGLSLKVDIPILRLHASPGKSASVVVSQKQRSRLEKKIDRLNTKLEVF